MTFSGRIQNTGSTAIKVLPELRRSRSTVRSRWVRPPATAPWSRQDGAEVPQLAPGATVDWKFTPTETELFGSNTPRPGVYAIDVDVFDPDGGFLGGQRTFVGVEAAVEGPEGPGRADVAGGRTPGLTGKKTPNNAAAPILPDRGGAAVPPGGRLNKILQTGNSARSTGSSIRTCSTPRPTGGGYFVPAPADSDNTHGSAPRAATNNAKDWDAGHSSSPR